MSENHNGIQLRKLHQPPENPPPDWPRGVHVAHVANCNCDTCSELLKRYWQGHVDPDEGQRAITEFDGGIYSDTGFTRPVSNTEVQDA